MTRWRLFACLIALAVSTGVTGQQSARTNATVSGTVTDERGEPAACAVTANVAPAPGSTQMGRLVARTATDRAGHYQFDNLPPGSYVIGAVPEGFREFHVKDDAGVDRTVVRVPVFYPRATAARDATPVAVAAGEAVAEISFQLQTAPATSVVATLSTASDAPFESVEVTIAPEDSDIDGRRAMRTTGLSVRMSAIAAGRYRLAATGTQRTPAGAVERVWSRTAVVDVDARAPAQVPLWLAPGARVSGRITFDGGNPPDRVSSLVGLTPVDDSMLVGMTRIEGASVVTPSNAFAITDIAPGRYAIQSSNTSATAPTWTLMRATAGERDLLDLPIDLEPGATLANVVLTFGDRPSELSGRVLDQDDHPRSDLTVVVFPSDHRYWWKGARRIKVARPDAMGRYSVQGLPAGTYLLSAVSDLKLEDAPDLALLNKLEAAAALPATIADGERKTQDLRVKR